MGYTKYRAQISDLLERIDIVLDNDIKAEDKTFGILCECKTLIQKMADELNYSQPYFCKD